MAMIGVVALRRFTRAHRHAVLRARRIHVDQVAGIGVTREEVAVIKSGIDDLVRQREQQRAVGTGTDGHPLVGNRRITGAHRID